MKPPKFHVGQAVTPTRVNDLNADDKVVFRPKMGAVYEVNWVQYIRRGDAKGWYIGCVEWPQDEAALEDLFAPVELLPDEALAELLAETLEPVTA